MPSWNAGPRVVQEPVAICEDARMAEREQPSHPAIPSEPNASDEPHDVLAAEQFAMPAPEAAVHDHPLELPPEPNASEKPHDVLAAEQFAMPAPPPHVAFEHASSRPAPRPRRRHLLAAGAAVLAAAAALARRRSRSVPRSHRDGHRS